MTRLNITLPDEIAQELATKRNKSSFIAEALSEKFEREKQKQMEQALFEGYNETSKEDAELQADWESTEIEGWK